MLIAAVGTFENEIGLGLAFAPAPYPPVGDDAGVIGVAAVGVYVHIVVVVPPQVTTPVNGGGVEIRVLYVLAAM